jgi:hypothetical protein
MIFHKKISSNTEFFDKNAWMGGMKYVIGSKRQIQPIKP